MTKVLSIETRYSGSSWLQVPYKLAHLACGHEDILGADSVSEMECSTCKAISDSLERLQAITEPVCHARFNPRFGGAYMLYKRDTISPSGVMLITSVVAGPAIDAQLRKMGISPLSPTER